MRTYLLRRPVYVRAVSSHTSHIHVLHVDDEPDFTELTAEFLKREDDRFIVLTSKRPSEGLELFRGNEIDCIVSDYEMPDKNGLEFLDAVRVENPEIPFILYTGKGSEEIASEAISAGVTDYLQKATGTDHYTLLANRIGNAVEQSWSEQEAVRANMRFDRLLEQSADYMFILDPDGTIDFISSSVESVLGYTSGELAGTDAFEYVHPDDLDRVDRKFADSLETPRNDITIEFRAHHQDGSWRWLEVRGRNLLEDSLVNGILVNARDITERAEGESQLKQFKEVVKHAAHAIYITDADGTIEYVNPAFERTTEYSADEAVGRNPRILNSGEMDESHYTNMWETLLAADVWEEEIVNRRQSGELYTAHQTIAPITSEAGEITAYVAIQIELTERKEHERDVQGKQNN